MRIEAWVAREIQLEARVGAERECLAKLAVQLKHDRIDDGAEDERNEEGFRDCLFTQYYGNFEASPLVRRTEREVRRDSCGKEHIVVTEGNEIHMLCAIVSFKTARRRVAQKQFASHVTVASGQFPRSKVVCSQTLLSRSSSENSSFALDA